MLTPTVIHTSLLWIQSTNSEHPIIFTTWWMFVVFILLYMWGVYLDWIHLAYFEFITSLYCYIRHYLKWDVSVADIPNFSSVSYSTVGYLTRVVLLLQSCTQHWILQYCSCVICWLLENRSNFHNFHLICSILFDFPTTQFVFPIGFCIIVLYLWSKFKHLWLSSLEQTAIKEEALCAVFTSFELVLLCKISSLYIIHCFAGNRLSFRRYEH